MCMSTEKVNKITLSFREQLDLGVRRENYIQYRKYSVQLEFWMQFYVSQNWLINWLKYQYLHLLRKAHNVIWAYFKV